MFDRESWFNSYPTVLISWGTSTWITFEQTILQYIKALFGVLNFQQATDLLTIKTPDDVLKLMTWIIATTIAGFSGWSRWKMNRAEERLKNAEATAIENGYSEEALENMKSFCRKEDCFFIEYYTKHQMENAEAKIKEEFTRRATSNTSIN